jgi:hypothetical protein
MAIFFCRFISLLLFVYQPLFVRGDEFSDHLAAIRGNDEQKIEEAIQFLAQQKRDPQRLKEVSQALNVLDQEGRRQSSEPALEVWATTDNTQLLVNILKEKRFDRGKVLTMIESLKDDKALLPLTDVLSDPFDDGKQAEAILLRWGKNADEAIVNRINDPNDEIHVRLVRLWEQRKISVEKRSLQSALDLGSQDEQTRKYAAEWLATQKTIPDSVKKQATASALEIAKSAKGFEALNATEVIAQLGHDGFVKEYKELLESEKFHQWQTGLHGVVHCQDISCAKSLFSRLGDEAFGGQVSKILTRHGAKSEALAFALLKQPVEKTRGYEHIVICGILKEIGTKKSLSALNALAKRKGIPANVNNSAKMAAAQIVEREKK